MISCEGARSDRGWVSGYGDGRRGEYMAKNADKLEKKVYSVPTEIDKEIARLKLEAMGVKIDTLTDEQVKYLGSWEEGT